MRWYHIAIAVLLLSGLSMGGYVVYARTAEAKANEEKFRPHIAAAERKWGMPAGLLHRQLYQESHFRTDIITGKKTSSAGAIGIAQIIPRWHPSIDPGDAAADAAAARDPYKAIDYAAKYMKQLYRQFGSWSLALAAYNAGPGKVSEYGGIPPFKETQTYVAEITRDVGVA